MKSDGGTAGVSYRNDGVVWDLAMRLDCALEPMAEIAGRAPVQTAPVPAREAQALDGCRILVVEDEALVALELIAVLEDAGATVCGPARTVEEALDMIEADSFQAALLDGNLHGKPVDVLAAALTRRGTPFAFVSGYGRESLPAAFAHAPVISKPFTPQQLVEVAGGLARRTENVVAFPAAAQTSR